MPENRSMIVRRMASFSGEPVGRGTPILSTHSRRSSGETAARAPRTASGTGVELGVEDTSLMGTTPRTSGRLGQELQQCGVEGRRVAHAGGVAAAVDDHLAAPFLR